MRAFRIGLVLLSVAAVCTACTAAGATPLPTTSVAAPSAAIVAPSATVGSAVAPTQAPSPSSAPVVSPQVNAEGTVTLRLRADGATDVTASGDIGSLTLTKDAQNVWSTTTAVLAPAIYRYYFTVDGTQIADPGNPAKMSATESMVTVPGNSPMPWEVRDVPHGKVTPITYQSAAFGTERRYTVYTPPGYETGTTKLPVLYLLHGYTNDDSSWTAIGKANLIADSLLADGKIKPMIIVMPYGQLNPDVSTTEAFADDFQKKFEKQILTELIPAVEKSYRALPDAMHRAMAGVSMGGMQAAFIGMNHPETFSSVGMWSAAVTGDPAILLSGLTATDDKVRHSFLYVQVAVGQQDDLHLVPSSEGIDAVLTALKIDHNFTETPGGTHSWLLWRGYLVDFLAKFSAL